MRGRAPAAQRDRRERQRDADAEEPVLQVQRLGSAAHRLRHARPGIRRDRRRRHGDEQHAPPVHRLLLERPPQAGDAVAEPCRGPGHRHDARSEHREPVWRRLLGEEDRARARDDGEASERRHARRLAVQPAGAACRRRVRLNVAGKVGDREHAHRVPDRHRPRREHADEQQLLLQIGEDLARLLDEDDERHADHQGEQRVDVEPGVAQRLHRATEDLLKKGITRLGRRRGRLGGRFALLELRPAQRFDLLEFHRFLPVLRTTARAIIAAAALLPYPRVLK